MKQKLKENEEVKANSGLDALRQEFKQEASKELTREVTLVVYETCGCGGSDFNIKRSVPFGSPLKNGDSIADNDLQYTDVVV